MNDLSNALVPFVPSSRGAGLNVKSSGHGSHLALLAVMGCLTGMAAADQFGDFTYEVVGSSISITDYRDTATGHVVIPSTIAGKPVKVIEGQAFNQIPGLTGITIPNSVTSIELGAFAECTGLTAVEIPSSVTNIAPEVFYGCTALTGVVIPSGVTTIENSLFEGCSSLAGVTIPNGVTSIGSKAFAQCVDLTAVAVPGTVTTIANSAFEGCDSLASVHLSDGLVSIGEYAFFDCVGLTHVEIPATVTGIDNGAFDQCDNLDNVFFMGGAPSMGESVFVGREPNPDLKIHYFSGQSGITSPTWLPEEYLTFSMGGYNPAAPWLIIHGLPLNSDLAADANGDGVNLLTACALDLDPSQNLSGSMPKAVVEGNQLGMSYYSGALGINYTVLTSTDLVTWTTEGVTISAPDGNLVRKATVNLGSGSRFVKLKLNN